MYNFEKNINYLTKNTSINKSKLAQLLNVSRQNLDLVIKKGTFKLSHALQISEIFNVPIQELIYDDLSLTYRIKISIEKI